MPRQVSFGNTPVPTRLTNRPASNVTSSTELHRTHSSYIFSKLPANTTLEQCVPAQDVKSMSTLDKQEEALMANLHKAKAMKGITGVMDWLMNKIKGDGGKSV
ncbi:hypothetical protein SVAN01_05725 [Stagonosporopsis vannaccii]|nr:hypothetical protein SVAN01_05725 [Stagonosporopsis vannaccii]